MFTESEVHVLRLRVDALQARLDAVEARERLRDLVEEQRMIETKTETQNTV